MILRSEKTETADIIFSKTFDDNASQRRQKMGNYVTVPFFRFYKTFVIAAPIVFVLMFIVYLIANTYFYLLVSEGKMDSDTANMIIGCFRIAPVIISAGILMLGVPAAQKRREKYIRMVEEIHEAEKDKNSIFSRI